MQLDLIPFRFPGLPHVHCGFGTRVLGNLSLDVAGAGDAERERRAALCARLGVEAFAEARQVHGVCTLFEPAAQDPELAAVTEADGLATARPGLALMIKTADCQPILLAHTGGRFVAAIHSGWRGNRQDYPRIAVEECCAHYGADPADVWAVRGPSLGPAASEFIYFDREWGGAFLPWYNAGRRTVDLWRLTRDQLLRAGIPEGQILSLDLCTFENSWLFFSYRHARALGSADGRQGSFIWMTS